MEDRLSRLGDRNRYPTEASDIETQRSFRMANLNPYSPPHQRAGPRSVSEQSRNHFAFYAFVAASSVSLFVYIACYSNYLLHDHWRLYDHWIPDPHWAKLVWFRLGRSMGLVMLLSLPFGLVFSLKLPRGKRRCISRGLSAATVAVPLLAGLPYDG